MELLIVKMCVQKKKNSVDCMLTIHKDVQKLEDKPPNSLQIQIKEFVCKTDETIYSSSDEIVISDNEVQEDNSPWVKVSSCNLYEIDKQILKSENSWINDNIINAAKSILHKQYPTISGFQDTQYSKNLGFKVETKQFIQILHVNENHWVTAFSKNLSTVSVYDSHRAKIYPVSFLEDIATILQTRNDKVTIVCENVDQQADVNQCGVYAVAFATALCLGLDPCDLKFDNPCKLRAHLVSMLEC